MVLRTNQAWRWEGSAAESSRKNWSYAAEPAGHPFYEGLNWVIAGAHFDAFCERECSKFYHSKLGPPSLAPGVYFRELLIGFFEGIGSGGGSRGRG
jgi:hypothetical protein